MNRFFCLGGGGGIVLRMENSPPPPMNRNSCIFTPIQYDFCNDRMTVINDIFTECEI